MPTKSNKIMIRHFSDLNDILIQEDELDDQYEPDFENEMSGSRRSTFSPYQNDTFLNESELEENEIKDISSPEVSNKVEKTDDSVNYLIFLILVL